MSLGKCCDTATPSSMASQINPVASHLWQVAHRDKAQGEPAVCHKKTIASRILLSNEL
jgi:hypothetical protein